MYRVSAIINSNSGYHNHNTLFESEEEPQVSALEGGIYKVRASDQVAYLPMSNVVSLFIIVVEGKEDA